MGLARVRFLAGLSVEGVDAYWDDLGWADAQVAETVRLEALPGGERGVEEHVRLSSAACAIDATLDLRGREPHQIASIRVQCAIAASSFGQAGLLVHAAGLALENRGGVVALAPSGGGKSTLSNLCTRFAGLSDETVLLQGGPPPRIFATPLRSSSTKVPEPRVDPLRALLILEKSLEPAFSRVPAPEALKVLLAQAYELPREIVSTAHRFKRASELVAHVPAYRFAFPKSPAAQDLLLRLFDEELDPQDP